MAGDRCDFRAIIDKYYPDDNRLRAIYMKHAGQVAGLALAINRERGLGLDPYEVEAAAMLHDIGIYATDAKGIGCEGAEPYMMHGVIGGGFSVRRVLPRNGRVWQSVTQARVSPWKISWRRICRFRLPTTARRRCWKSSCAMPTNSIPKAAIWRRNRCRVCATP